MSSNSYMWRQERGMKRYISTHEITLKKFIIENWYSLGLDWTPIVLDPNKNIFTPRLKNHNESVSFKWFNQWCNIITSSVETVYGCHSVTSNIVILSLVHLKLHPEKNCQTKFFKLRLIKLKRFQMVQRSLEN